MNKKSFQELFLHWVKRLLFPDFSNKLTMMVAGAGVGLLVVPDQLWLVMINWGIDVFNGLGFSFSPLPQLPFGPDPTGLWLVLAALCHNLVARWIAVRVDVLNHEVARDKRQLDVQLYGRFLELLPSDGNAVLLLKEHDFSNSFFFAHLDNLRRFSDVWGNAENRFLNVPIEEEKSKLLQMTDEFLLKIATYTAPRGHGFQTAYPTSVDPEVFVPEHIRSEIKELNEGASSVYKQHQKFVSRCREQL